MARRNAFFLSPSLVVYRSSSLYRTVPVFHGIIVVSRRSNGASSYRTVSYIVKWTWALDHDSSSPMP